MSFENPKPQSKYFGRYKGVIYRIDVQQALWSCVPTVP